MVKPDIQLKVYKKNPGSIIKMLGNGLFIAVIEIIDKDKPEDEGQFIDAVFNFDDIATFRPAYDLEEKICYGTYLYTRSYNSFYITCEPSILLSHYLDYKNGQQKIHLHPS